jgi:adenylate cyclase
MTAIRRLAAILAADVAGYSRLIGTDEEGTLNRLRSIRAEVIDPKITEHRGRIVKTTGECGGAVEAASRTKRVGGRSFEIAVMRCWRSICMARTNEPFGFHT